MKNIYAFTLEDLEEYLLSINEKKYRAKQIYEWLYKKKVKSFKEMTNLSSELIEKLEQDLYLNEFKLMVEQKDKDVSKYLFRLKDNNMIETVLMKHNYGNSICISTQLGCNMGCVFCESGKNKKLRNLEVDEMVYQVLEVERLSNDRIDSIVLMGIGEPFDNYDNVMKFIKIINHHLSLNIGIRHITISTCGIIPKIKELTSEGMQVNLAISLHASNDKLRSEIMPINKVYPLEDLIKEIKNYIDVTNRRITFEYIMLEGKNDSKENALELSKLLKGINCYVNLIPYNQTSNETLKASRKENLMAFYDTLKKNNINVTIRREFGSNIDGACGQLKSQY